MKRILPFVILMFNFHSAQILISNQKDTSSSGLIDISSSTSKGLLPPRLSYTDQNLNTKTQPILNPSEGLFFYNPNSTIQFPGYYLRSDNYWNLVSSDNNKTTDMLRYKTLNSTLVTFNPGETYSDFNISSLSNELINTAGVIISGNNITLNKGTYIITLTLNVKTTEGVTGGINNKAVHVHSYRLRCTDTTGNIIPTSNEFKVNLNSNGNSASQRHTLVARISFSLPATTTVKLQMSRNLSNSTYTGDLAYDNASLHILNAIRK